MFYGQFIQSNTRLRITIKFIEHDSLNMLRNWNMPQNVWIWLECFMCSSHARVWARDGTIWFVRTWHRFFFFRQRPTDNCIKRTNWSVSKSWRSFRINSIWIARSHFWFVYVRSGCHVCFYAWIITKINYDYTISIHHFQSAMSYSVCVFAYHINLLCQFCLKINDGNFGY